jgi:CheY-like chemotaxis protein
MRVARPVILLMENDEGDVFLFRRALAKTGFHGTVRVVETLSAARRYLANCGEFLDKQYFPCPDIIVSDMNVSGNTGNELIVWAKQNPETSSIPFVFLSGSFSREERERANQLGANGFFKKTGNIDEAVETVRQILGHLQSTGAS